MPNEERFSRWGKDPDLIRTNLTLPWLDQFWRELDFYILQGILHGPTLLIHPSQQVSSEV